MNPSDEGKAIMSLHQFRVGQMVRLKSRVGLMHRTPEIFQVKLMLPPMQNLPQYRIRSEAENYDRVVTQDSIEAVDSVF